MPATEPSQDNPPAADEPSDGLPTPKPDEDGPHDVPDDKVIEKTLPSKPGSAIKPTSEP